MSRGLPENVANLLNKSKGAALLAIETYNKPNSSFRSGAFIVLMCIAWNSLLQAIFEKQGVKYFYKNKNGRYIHVDGEKKAWELEKCVSHYFSENNSIRKNLELFVALRNKIEHRYMPYMDPEIVGECQALLLNFEELLVGHFGQKHSLVDYLFIPLQITERKRALPRKSNERKLIEFIKDYRNSLSEDVTNDPRFSFRAYLIPKIGNHASSSDLAIEFVRYDPNRPEEMQSFEHLVVAIKEKHTQVANQGKYRPKKVLEIIEQQTQVKKSMEWHTDMWKKYKVRPDRAAVNKADCDSRYCQFDASSYHQDYVYTDQWIDLLVKDEI